jgi:hypothetical protein
MTSHYFMQCKLSKPSYSAWESVKRSKETMFTTWKISMPQIGRLFKFESKKIIRNSVPTGIRYEWWHPYKNKLVWHTSSAPGQPPAIFTRDLYRGIDSEVRGMQFSVGVKDVDYASALETGTRKMAARPYLLPAILSKRNESLMIIEKDALKLYKRFRGFNH